MHHKAYKPAEVTKKEKTVKTMIETFGSSEEDPRTNRNESNQVRETQEFAPEELDVSRYSDEEEEEESSEKSDEYDYEPYEDPRNSEKAA